jgi:hypothetical protein
MSERTRDLKRALRGAVTWVMASSSVTWGCSGVGPGIEDDPGFVGAECEAREQSLLEGLRPEPDRDYLELRSVNGGTTASVGDACRTSEDQAACATALQQASASKGFRLGPCVDVCFEQYLVATAGDTVTVLDSKEEVTALLGPIDSPQEAMLLVAMEGFDVRCGDGGAKPDGAGFMVQGFSYQGCDGVTRHQLQVAPDGTVSPGAQEVLEKPDSNCSVGRRPAGLGAPAPDCDSPPAGRYLAQAARLEAASVYAFLDIERELAAHGAPSHLVDAARCAAEDEVRHARMTAGLARRFGARRVERPQVDSTSPRDLEGLLLDNAIEGCVRETYGAAVGVWQAENAVDPVVAKCMRQIAEDELRHAELAWAIAAWFEPKLSASSRRRIREARRAAITELRGELHQPVDTAVTGALGVPSAEAALRLHEELERRVWS